MFSPTQLPCTAWYVTATLNVRECTVLERREYRINRDWYGTSSGEKHVTHLFSTRDEAIAEAGTRLSKMHDAYIRAGQRWTKARGVVEALKKGGA